jgi:hypothetical protein
MIYRITVCVIKLDCTCTVMWLSSHDDGACIHRVAAQQSEESGKFLQVAESVLGALLRHGRLEADEEEVVEVLGGAGV